MDVHCAGVPGVIIFPDRFEHLFPAEHCAPVGYEHLQQVKLLGGQFDVFSAQGYTPFDQVYFHIVNPDHAVLLLLHAAGYPAENRLDPGFHFKDIWADAGMLASNAAMLKEFIGYWGYRLLRH